MRCQKLNLNSVDTVNAVDEKNENKDEGYLHPILEFGYDRVFRNEAGQSH